MSYSTGSHTVFYHRYHIVWITKYRYKVLQGKLRERVRDIIRQVCREMGVQIIEGVLSSDHIHMFVSVPPHVAAPRCHQRSHATRQRAFFLQNPDGVPGNPQALLGAEILGPRIFLHHQW
jgi:putative transposase